MKKAHWIGIGIASVVTVAVLCTVLFSASGEKPSVPQHESASGEKPSVPQHESAKGRKRHAFLSQKGAKTSVVKAMAVPSQTGIPVTGKTGKGKRASLGVRVGAMSEDDVFRDENGNAYPEKDQMLMRQARDAIDNDDLESARALAAEAVSSPNDELREMVVEALSWFGKDALAELTLFMADPNEEVAEAAKDGWIGGVQEISKDGEKAGVIEAALHSLRDSETLEDVANELIDIDELAAIQVLANVIEDGKNPDAVAAAKEAYNSITDSDWTGIDAAEAWLQENYEPDDDDDDDDDDDGDDDK